MTKEALKLMGSLEEQLVSSGTAGLQPDSRSAELIAASLIELLPGNGYTLTEKGWTFAHAYRRYRARFSGEIRIGTEPPFVDPRDPSEEVQVRDIAKDAFVRAIGGNPAAQNHAAVADSCLTAAEAFRARLRTRT